MVLLLLSFPYEEDTLLIIYFLFFFLMEATNTKKNKIKKTEFKKLSRWKVEHITDSRGKYEGRKIR